MDQPRSSASLWWILPVLVLAGAPSGLYAQFTCATNKGTITIVRYTGPGGVVTIPETLNGLPVVTIDYGAFASADVSSVTVPNTVTSIGKYAFAESALIYFTIPESVTNLGERVFYRCSKLESVVIPSGITTVPTEAFDHCALTNATISEGVTSIGDYAFAQCYALRNIRLPESVTNIGVSSFADTGLTNVTMGDGLISIAEEAFLWCYYLPNVTIPRNVASIGDRAFFGCINLTGFDVVALNTTYSSRDGVLFSNSQTTLILYPPGKTGAYKVPDSVRKIADRAFTKCLNLTNIDLPAGLTAIGEWAFCLCSNVRDLVLPDSVTHIGAFAFRECTTLTSLTIPGGVEWGLAPVIGGGSVNPKEESQAFYGCSSLTNITVEDGVGSIPPLCFAYCSKVQSARLPASLTSIGDWAFEECSSLVAVTIPDNVSHLGLGVFSRCSSLKDVRLGKGITSFDGWLELDPEAFGVYGGVFERCVNLTRIDIPDGVKTIGFGTFRYTGLTNLTIPGSVTRIEREAFTYCPNLSEIYFKGNAPTVDPNAFSSESSAMIYYLPETTGWEPAVGGRPTALWLPKVDTNPGTFGVYGHQFGFTVDWVDGKTIVVEACTNAANQNWQSLQTNTLIGDSYYFSDPGWRNHPARFYRIRSSW